MFVASFSIGKHWLSTYNVRSKSVKPCKVILQRHVNTFRTNYRHPLVQISCASPPGDHREGIDRDQKGQTGVEEMDISVPPDSNNFLQRKTRVVCLAQASKLLICRSLCMISAFSAEEVH